MQIFEKSKIRTTNSLVNMLDFIGSINFVNNLNDIDILSGLKAEWDVDKYEEKEKEIPELIYEVLKKESNTFTKLVKRNYVEDDAWLVTIERKEYEALEDHDHEVSNIEEFDFVKIHVPKIFVRTLCLPMIFRNY